jgi:beta-glucosidase
MSAHLPDPDRLAFGVATAAYQVEGAVDEDGRGPSIWDTFTRVPGAVTDGSDGSVACDSYHRVADDVALISGLGVSHYRFSIGWPRVQPDGSGAVETRGLGYYDRLVDALLEQDLTPMATLYHWDLPQALEDRGGWLVRDTAERFADYAALVHARLGDRVQVWATHNEPWCAAYLGYAAGIHAPGRREGGDAHRAAHHLLLGHGLAAGRLHAAGADAVGIVLNLTPVWPDRPEAAAVADGVDAIRNRVWLDALVDGAYDDRLLALAPVLADPAVVRDGDLTLVQGSADWLGVNYYTPSRVDVLPTPLTRQKRSVEPSEMAVADDPFGRLDEPFRAARRESGGDAAVDAFPGVHGLRFTPRHPRTDIGWEIEPRGLEEVLVEAHRRTGLPLVVSENGAACADDRHTPDGAVDDQDRIGYLEAHINATERARARGADVRAYLLWTLLDNFEWAEGYTKTFGLVHVDRDDLARTPKASYHWVARRLAQHPPQEQPPPR